MPGREDGEDPGWAWAAVAHPGPHPSISPQEDAPPNVPEVAAAQEELQLATETLNGQGV